MQARDIIREYIKSNLIVFDDDLVIGDDDNIFLKGFVNSLFAMKLLNFIESEFGIKVDDEDIEIKNFNSINNIMILVKKKKDVE
jgi:methoxymalonate biosynthesis acyl carrier protein